MEHTRGGLWPPQESCYLRGHKQGGTHRERRRCDPPVGRTRATSPWCPPALTGLTATERGVSTRPVRLSILAAALLFVSVSHGD